MQVRDYTVSQEQVDKITVWACTTPSFNLAQLSSQIHRSRVPMDLSAPVAQRFLNKWKGEGKIKFDKGRWRWQK